MSTAILRPPWFEAPPRLGPCKVELRPYQNEAITAVRNEFASGKKSTLMILPTGSGKTITFGMICRRAIEKNSRVLILAHRQELIQQAADKLDSLGVEVGIEMAGEYARATYDPDVVIATVQTLQRKRLETWPRNHFNLIVTDEAHHATAASYQRIYQYFQGARHLGVTATADRADEDQLGDVFESVAYELSLWDAMTAEPPGPYLCRVKFVQCDVQIDLRDIRTTGGDFNQGDLEERIKPYIEILANAIKKEIGNRRTLVFTPDVGSAQAMASALRSLDLNADWVSGADPDRTVKVQSLHDGRTQILCNCALLTEGFDCPEIAAIVLCRPTKSRALYSQMVGRGTRLARDKENCLIVDFDYLTAKHDLVKPYELFDSTKMHQEVLDLARDILKKSEGKPKDLMDAIQEAQDEHKRRQVLRVKARERDVKYKRVSYDPLSLCDAVGYAWRGGKDAVIDRATEGQVRYLKSFGVEDAPNLSKGRARTMLDYLTARRKAGLATPKQCAWLIAKGTEPEIARSMTFKEASAQLDVLFNQRSA